MLEHDDLHISHSLHAVIREGRYEVRAFEAIMRGCAARQETGITETFLTTYTRLHEAELAHRVAV